MWSLHALGKTDDRLKKEEFRLKMFFSDVMERLVLVLAHLFGRRYIPAKFQEANLKFYQSKVFLEDLPEDFKAALDEYNMNVTKGLPPSCWLFPNWRT
ncbi:putative ATP-dependent RNA helicase DDX60 [Camelus dromedarius]|uniref:Putative ATP-dependent RNA helicase DDX60 n=1 Tax=Camelus dromedarius TaxID=9838 RepID=A0A5N4C0J5_CAMDR|nr:putative ATP-dependent RNA helicase DDX60 [Camelus dromedarius]